MKSATGSPSGRRLSLHLVIPVRLGLARHQPRVDRGVETVGSRYLAARGGAVPLCGRLIARPPALLAAALLAAGMIAAAGIGAVIAGVAVQA